MKIVICSETTCSCSKADCYALVKLDDNTYAINNLFNNITYLTISFGELIDKIKTRSLFVNGKKLSNSSYKKLSSHFEV